MMQEEIKKQTWQKPEILDLDVKNTEGGIRMYTLEDTHTYVAGYRLS